ncbi:MAG: isoprenylcysteine carboxylmethyltransferase family protein [Sulfobacillus benefaciens]|uniref:Isoprenylcysteine carboxylmethyltransferase family protein n=1 Tax=Sulfobacillus benefaciens TaxID=453960 RepID=A0A2T2XHA7_9FIRM|nr:MAG: isoprenylcysteine carboxylmethyltransferase family protein [Sulfobacillus benefaciens]
MITSIVNSLLLIWLILDVIAIMRHRLPSTPDQDKGSFRVIWITVAAAFLLSDTIGFWGRVWNPPIPIGLRMTGIALVVLGIIFRQYSIRVLGRYFTPQVAIQDQHVLIRRGPYRWLRHPSYTGAWIAFIGVGLSSHGVLVLLMFTVIPFMGLLYRIHVEEEALRQALGTAYDDYAKSTWRLIPFVY